MNSQGYKAVYSIAALLLTGLSIAAAVIVDQYLWSIYYWYTSYNYNYYDTCYMSPPDTSDINVCYYSWTINAIGIFIALWLAIMGACSGPYSRSRWNMGILLFSAMWWLAGAIVVQIYSDQADDFANGPPSSDTSTANQQVEWAEKEGWRHAMCGINWAAFAVSFLGFIAALKDIKSNANAPPPQAQFAAQGAYGAPYGGAPYPGGPPPTEYGGYANPGQPYGGPPPPAGYGAPPPGVPAGYPQTAPAYPPAPQPGSYPPPTATGYPPVDPAAGANAAPVWTTKP